MLDPKYSPFAVVLTIFLITFLAYSSQLFLLTLTTRQTYIFNALVACIWITYARCIFTDPGSTPRGWTPSWQTGDVEGVFNGGDEDRVGEEDGEEEEEESEEGEEEKVVVREESKPDKKGRVFGNADCRWCKKCRGWKPARAHHCKTCQKCVLLMDHHCPWTMNCVGYRNWPHFIRFLTYVAITCGYLQKFLFVYCLDIYEARNLPAYLGPSITQFVLLGFLLIVNILTLSSIVVLYIRIVTSIFEGYTTIEWWEQERHGILVRRKVVRRQIFPYDVGVFENLALFMGGGGFSLLLCWFPFAPNRRVGENEFDGGGLRYEVNGFEKTWMAWPPPDPEKFGITERRNYAKAMEAGPWTKGEFSVNDVQDFRRRQREDLKRAERQGGGNRRRGYKEQEEDDYEDDGVDREEIFDEYVEVGYTSGRSDAYTANADEPERKKYESPKKRWRNEEGHTLEDYGVDEDADVIDDDDSIPLAELMRRQRERGILEMDMGKGL